jgi:hypothetical protein
MLFCREVEVGIEKEYYRKLMSTLNRFLEAQDLIFDQVVLELKFGRKSGHWMWYIFPQLALGMSSISSFIQSRVGKKPLNICIIPF